jgi:hypothetical protein
MKALTKKPVIVSLIKDDIINSCLVNRLNKAGLDAGDYYLHLSETIFTLLKFEDNFRTEKIYKKYLKLTQRITPKHIHDEREEIDRLANEIFDFLADQQVKTKSKNQK